MKILFCVSFLAVSFQSCRTTSNSTGNSGFKSDSAQSVFAKTPDELRKAASMDDIYMYCSDLADFEADRDNKSKSEVGCGPAFISSFYGLRLEDTVLLYSTGKLETTWSGPDHQSANISLNGVVIGSVDMSAKKIVRLIDDEDNFKGEIVFKINFADKTRLEGPAIELKNKKKFTKYTLKLNQ